MKKRIIRATTLCLLTSIITISSYKNSVSNDDIFEEADNTIKTIDEIPVKEKLNIDLLMASYYEMDMNKEKKKEYVTGWTTTAVNVRQEPNTDSYIIDTYSFNVEVEYRDYNDEWVEITYDNSTAYICKKYISDTKCEYREYAVPRTSGFKSYMSYKSITCKSSPQYKLQATNAYTGNYGIRQVNGRYCVAIGSYFTSKIGVLFDLVLENGTIIPCILADQKADKDTDSQNIVTGHNGCMSEFVVDYDALNNKAKNMGDISYCNEDWKSPVKYVRVYE